MLQKPKLLKTETKSQPTINRKARDNFFNHVKEKYPNDYIDKQVRKKIINSFIRKAIDKTLKGQTVNFASNGDRHSQMNTYTLGNLLIFKKKSKNDMFIKSTCNDFDKILHEYHYFIRFEGNVSRSTRNKFTCSSRVSSYIKDIVIKNNIDVPLFNPKDYFRTKTKKQKS